MDQLSALDEDVILPGFRFHPTDEELLTFYLQRKVQRKPIAIEVISQVDIYKFDPWELPATGNATSGEHESYFFCPRDRKYRNSNRPNRVTTGGFWKATGTDRVVYSPSNRSKCIGLKKSLVFYKGRASKAFKTNWMMHEFRLPAKSQGLLEPSPEERWTVCKIFNKSRKDGKATQVHHSNSESASGHSQGTTTETSSVYSQVASPLLTNWEVFCLMDLPELA